VAKENQPQLNFQGFQSPNFTSVPDDVFDMLLPHLTGSELKVLLYIIRRTYGFKKSSDSISLSQMLTGITTKDGQVLDRGAGVAKQALLRALRSLHEKNIIRSRRQRSQDRGDEPTIYSLVMASDTPGMKMAPPVVAESYQGVVAQSGQDGGNDFAPGPRADNHTTQETVKQKTDGQKTVRQQQQNVADALIEFRMNESTVKNIVETHPAEFILEKVGHVRWLIAQNPEAVQNPAGFLRKAIEDNWPAPPGYTALVTEEPTVDCAVCQGTGWHAVGSVLVHCDHTEEPSPLADLPPESG
jgi:hypothetical protein